jgi:predicted ATPase
VFNLLLYYLLENRRVFLILEEPESHLYPESQQTIGEVLALFCNEKNAELLTTHSPYMLGTFNYLLLAGQVPDSKADILKKTLHKRYWISPSIAAAYHVHDGILENAMDTEDDLILIDNSLIDGASRRINEISDNIIELLDSEAGEA